MADGGWRGGGVVATSCIVRSQRDKFIIALMRVRRGFLPQPPQGALWRLAAVREIGTRPWKGCGRENGRGRREEREVPPGTGSLIFQGLRQKEVSPLCKVLLFQPIIIN